MLIILDSAHRPEDLRRVTSVISSSGLTPVVSPQSGRTVILTESQPESHVREHLRGLPGIERVLEFDGPHRLTTRSYQPADTVVDAAGVAIGGTGFAITAGPCAVEGRQQTLDVAHAVAAAGASLLRGGVFKPRSSPYSFQGLGTAALEILAEASENTGLPVVTEVMEPAQIELVAHTVSVLQIGARNMQNFPLLREVGQSGIPVLLKRGLSATISEWLLAAEYVMNAGNPNVVLCERGIRTYEPATRFTLDLSAIPVVQRASHLPVIVDPSHATGHSYLVRPLALAAAAAGADGLLIDVHDHAAEARCDGAQAINSAEFTEFVGDVRRLLAASDRPLATPSVLLTQFT